MMTYLMPVMMLWVMWAAPSGLLLYWFFGNIVSFGQQMVINRMNKTNDAAGNGDRRFGAEECEEGKAEIEYVVEFRVQASACLSANERHAKA